MRFRDEEVGECVNRLVSSILGVAAVAAVNLGSVPHFFISWDIKTAGSCSRSGGISSHVCSYQRLWLTLSDCHLAREEL